MPTPSPRSSRKRQARSQANRPNRQAEIAARVRAAQTHEDVDAVGVERAEEPAPPDPVAPVEPRVRSGLQPAQRNVRRLVTGARTPGMQIRRLSREQEYMFIKADLRRLLITAGSLAVVMLVLLFVIER